MPKGVYQRKPGQKRHYTPEQIAAFTERLKKAREKSNASKKALDVRSENIKHAHTRRTARAILKHLPVGAVPGTEFKASLYRNMRVIDSAPVKVIGEDGGVSWEQKFEQYGKITMYGKTHVFSGVCRVVWDYEPTLENIMDAPRFDEANASTE